MKTVTKRGERDVGETPSAKQKIRLSKWIVLQVKADLVGSFKEEKRLTVEAIAVEPKQQRLQHKKLTRWDGAG